MKILSIYPYTHISSAALMINGKIVAAAPEERFNRIKMSTSFPFKAIEWCLKKENLKLKDMDLITVPWNPAININSASSRWTNDLRWRGEMLSNIPINLMKILDDQPSNYMKLSFNDLEVNYLNHHECHAASAFFTSPFRNCDILTIDGHGEKDTCFLGIGKNNDVKQKSAIKYPHSVGLFYGTFTDFLGFKPDSDEWKVMALSSYATKKNVYDKKIKKLFKLTKNGFELDLSYFDFYTFDKRKNFFNEKFELLLGKKRVKNEKIMRNHYLIAGAMQRAFEKIVFHLLKILKSKGSKSNNLVLAGGAAMNCVFNGLLDKSSLYKNNYIPAYPDDLGVSIGAAYLANYRFNKKKKRIIFHEKHNYYGPGFSRNEIKDEILKSKLKFYEFTKDLTKETAKYLSKGKLVGWFQGNMEFSHRALGNRSILADPRSSKVKDLVNQAIKFRESFRPFAPAVLDREAYKIFHMKKNDKIYFMEKAVKVRKVWRKKIPAITHIDNTARVQTVNKSINPIFYDLISEFYKITKTPVLLNTSFNLNGEPIVCSPKDAIRTFFSCGLDILVLGNFIIKKND